MGSTLSVARTSADPAQHPPYPRGGRARTDPQNPGHTWRGSPGACLWAAKTEPYAAATGLVATIVYWKAALRAAIAGAHRQVDRGRTLVSPRRHRRDEKAQKVRLVHAPHTPSTISVSSIAPLSHAPPAHVHAPDSSVRDMDLLAGRSIVR